MLRTTWHLAHFFAFFFSPHDVLHTCQHKGVPLYRGGGVPYMRMRTGQLPTKMDDTQDSPFPQPMHIALRMSHHLVVKPQSTMVQTNDIVQM